MKILSLLFVSLLSLSCFSQDEAQVEEKLKSLYKEKNFKKIIQDYSKNVETYSARSIYYVGLAYYYTSEDLKCIKTMDLSIRKDNTDPDPQYIKAQALLYSNRFNEAVLWYNNAIELSPDVSEFYAGLGDAYFNLSKLDRALDAYLLSASKPNAIDRPFAMIPQIYAEMGNEEKALEAFYVAKRELKNNPESYAIALYNIGLYEYLAGNHEKAEQAYTELIELNSKDYQSISKLIQVYYAQKEPDLAEPYKEQLYEAHKKDRLPKNMKSMFCFDQFEWNEQVVQVYERFAEPEGELYYKHLFYVLDDDNQIEYRIQTENSPVSISMGGDKYAIGMDKNGTHSTFGFIDEDFEYEDLKSVVVQILDKQITAAASSKVTTNKKDKKNK